MTVQSDYVVFKNALVYTVTFRVVASLSHDSEEDILTLACTAFVATTLLQTMVPLAASQCQTADRFGKPVFGVLTFTLETLISAGVHMQSNLIGAYTATIFRADAGPIYLAVTSFLTIVLVWVLGVSLGAIEVWADRDAR